MRPDIYYTIYDWMIKKLSLKGAELLVLAYLYQVEKSDQRPRTLLEISEATGYSERQCKRAIATLLFLGYLDREKEPKIIGAKIFYWMNTTAVFSAAFPDKK